MQDARLVKSVIRVVFLVSDIPPQTVQLHGPPRRAALSNCTVGGGVYPAEWVLFFTAVAHQNALFCAERQEELDS